MDFLKKAYEKISPEVRLKICFAYEGIFTFLIIAKLGGLLNIHIAYRLILVILYIIALFGCRRGYIMRNNNSEESKKSIIFKWDIYLSPIEILIMLL